MWTKYGKLWGDNIINSFAYSYWLFTKCYDENYRISKCHIFLLFLSYLLPIFTVLFKMFYSFYWLNSNLDWISPLTACYHTFINHPYFFWCAMHVRFVPHSKLYHNLLQLYCRLYCASMHQSLMWSISWWARLANSCCFMAREGQVSWSCLVGTASTGSLREARLKSTAGKTTNVYNPLTARVRLHCISAVFSDWCSGSAARKLTKKGPHISKLTPFHHTLQPLFGFIKITAAPPARGEGVNTPGSQGPAGAHDIALETFKIAFVDNLL